MKILFIAADINKIGGIEKYNREFIDALREAGADVFFIPLYGIKLFQKISFIARVFLESFRKKPNIICCSHVAFSPICYFIKKILGIEYTVNVYGIEVANIPALHKSALKSAKFIIKLFDQTAQNVIKQIPEVAERILALPNSVDGERFYIKEKSQNLIKRHNLRDSKIILTICRFSYSEVDNKGYEKVVRAMSDIVKKIPNVKYLLVGGGNDAERMKNLVKELGLENNVILTGPAKDEEMVDYYNLADVFILPSKREGFPAIVLLEALACGKPIIGGNQGEEYEKKNFDGKLGYTINPDNQEELKEAIINVLKRKAPKKFFDPKFLRDSILKEYSKVCHKERVKDILNLFKIPKLAIIMSHAIQYQVPLLRKLAFSEKVDLMVYFNWDFGVKETYESDFGVKVKWDIPILDGYKHKFLKNFSLRPSSGFWGQLNFGIISALVRGRYKAVLIYGWNSFVNWLAFFTALIIGTPVIIQGESPLNQELLKSGWKQKVKKFIFKKLFFPRISSFLYIGEENRKFYKYYGVPDEKLFFVPYAVDNERYITAKKELGIKNYKLREELGIKKDAIVILFVGKLIEKKRPFDLLKAYKNLENIKTQEHKNISLIFVGDGNLRRDLENYAQSHNLKNVHFVGFKNQTELPEYYALSDIFVLPSGIGETWGLVVNEAMCFSLPVIVSDMVGCALDLIKENQNGFIFPLGNIEKLAEYLKELILNENKRKIFSEKSFEIIQNYSHKKDIEGILEVLRYIK